MPEPKRPLTPANQNPWYVLMTLYGEQDGEEVDEALHEKNMEAWNAWACQGMSTVERQKAAELIGVTDGHIRFWSQNHSRVIHALQEIMSERNRNSPEFIYPGTPDFNHRIDLSSTRFSKILNMGRFIFGRHLFIERSVAERSLILSGAILNRGIEIHETDLESVSNFSDTQVFGIAKYQNVNFRKEANFDNATFTQEVFYNSSNFFDQGSFFSSNFNKTAWFPDVNFHGRAIFFNSVFESNSYFVNTHFEELAGFYASTFNGHAYFNMASFFGKGGFHIVTFSDAHFSKPASFHNADFKFAYPELSGTVLHDKTTFTDHPDHWPKGKQADPEQAKASCAVIRHNLGRQGLPEAEHFFFRREMGFAGQIGKWWQRAPYLCFGLLSDYGYSIARPAIWLLCLWCIGFMAFWGYFLTHAAQARPMGTAFALSFSNLFQVFGFSRLYFDTDFMQGLPLVLQIYSGLQTVLAVPLLFFLALGLRTRFRMR